MSFYNNVFEPKEYTVKIGDITVTFTGWLVGNFTVEQLYVRSRAHAQALCDASGSGAVHVMFYTYNTSHPYLHSAYCIDFNPAIMNIVPNN